MRRVVVTGMGIVSPIGNNADEVVQSLRAGRSGIVAEPVYAEYGFRSQVAGIPQIDLAAEIDKRDLRFMGAGAAYNFIAMRQAIADAGLEPGEVSTRARAGDGLGRLSTPISSSRINGEEKQPERMRLMITRCMSSHSAADTPCDQGDYSITRCSRARMHRMCELIRWQQISCSRARE
jgi:3-oxoacyl-(acyl-carrier-protein) synthase